MNLELFELHRAVALRSSRRRRPAPEGPRPRALFLPVLRRLARRPHDDAGPARLEGVSDIWANHDPTQLNRQRPDYGIQHRSGISHHDDAQEHAARASKEALQASGRYRRPAALAIITLSLATGLVPNLAPAWHFVQPTLGPALRAGLSEGALDSRPGTVVVEATSNPSASFASASDDGLVRPGMASTVDMAAAGDAGLASVDALGASKGSETDGASRSTLAVGTDRYVSPSGSDSNSGTQSAPFRTIQKAVSVAAAGDTIIVRPGAYSAATISGKSGTVSAPITLKAEFPATAVSAESRSTLTGGGSGYGIYISGALTYWIIDGFEVSNFRGGLYLDTGPNSVIIRNNIFRSNTGVGVSCWKCDAITIEQNQFLDPGPSYPTLNDAIMDYGVNFYHSTGNRIVNNYFFGKFNHDISLKNNVFDTLIAYNTFEGCMYQCIELGQEPDNTSEGDLTSARATVEYNLFRDAVDARSGAYYRARDGVFISNIEDATVRNNFFENIFTYPIRVGYETFSDNYHTGRLPGGAEIYGNTFVNPRASDPSNGDNGARTVARIEYRGNPSDRINFYNNTTMGFATQIRNPDGVSVIDRNNLYDPAPSNFTGPISSFDPFANRGPSPAYSPDWSRKEMYRLVSSSEYIDAGVNVGLAFVGRAPDLGSNEFIPASARLEDSDPTTGLSD
jgi:Right handed beta helix region/Peptide methionine sulfoxide reductase